ncbi:hypothetical protein ACHHYP_15161 [Achlya hypogyna]|uniref:DEAD/DEAH box RNA helicase n=1 Tax=Achlya hypogyna TaxID=1202772 RepID=A0A1V9YBK1_ACHHY|nr:hypothetical protein ACHHYP_15161 [Achlya hypogyna]
MPAAVEAGVVATSVAQRWPVADEPTCVLCGRYGAYICDATDEDVCSLECRDACCARAETNRFRAEFGLSVVPDNSTPLATDFASLDLAPELLANMTELELQQPTPIQMQVIPLALDGTDIVVHAPTGTGKTVAFLLPLLARTMAVRFDSETTGILGLVIAPVRELCVQIESQIKALVHGIPKMRTALLVGGMPLPSQLHRLSQGVQVAVGTPGRLLSIHTEHGLSLDHVVSCVVDEVDMLCEDEFRGAVTTLLSLLSASRQLSLVTATVTDRVHVFASDVAAGAVVVTQTPPSTAASQCIPSHISQHVVYVGNEHKTTKLMELLRNKPDDPLHATMVFVASQQGADMLVKSIFTACHLPAVSLHGGKTQAARMQAMESFVSGAASILVSTYVLGRGMDLLAVDDVVVFDFPPTIDEYIHIAGRAGRGGDPGRATVFVNADSSALFPALVAGVWRDLSDLPRQVKEAALVHRRRERVAVAALGTRANAVSEPKRKAMASASGRVSKASKLYH